jgi:cell division protein ZapA
MASIDIEVAGRRYTVACRDGEEAHLRSVAAMVDQRAREAAEALGSLPESRQLLFAALLMADDIKELRAGAGAADAPPPPADPAVAEALERLAARMEALAESLERKAPTP